MRTVLLSKSPNPLILKVNLVFTFCFSSLLILVCSCSSQAVLKVTIDESCFTPADSVLYLYLIDKKLDKTLQDMKREYETEYDPALFKPDTQPIFLEKQYSDLTEKWEQIKTQKDPVNTDELKIIKQNLVFKPIQYANKNHQEYLYIKATNKTPYSFDSLKVNIHYLNEIIGYNYSILSPVDRNEVIVFAPLIFNSPKTRQITPDIEDFSISLSRVFYENPIKNEELRTLQYQMMDISMKLDKYTTTTPKDPNEVYFFPINNLIMNQIKENRLDTKIITQSGSINLGRLSKGNYSIILFTSYRSPIQWYKPISLDENEDLILNSENTNQFFLGHF